MPQPRPGNPKFPTLALRPARCIARHPVRGRSVPPRGTRRFVTLWGVAANGGGTLYSLISAALFSLGVGTLLRSTAASLTAALTVLLLLLLPGILSFIRLDWVETIVSYLPLPASSALLTTGAVETQGAYLSAQASLIVMAAYAVVPIAAAAVTLHRRDA